MTTGARCVAGDSGKSAVASRQATCHGAHVITSHRTHRNEGRFAIARCACSIAVVLLVACSATESVTTETGVNGYWGTDSKARPGINFQIATTGTSISGTGTVATPPLAPTSGPATPVYTGDNFTITTGTFIAPNVSFTASVGANPDGVGGFFRGTLAFAGTMNGNSMIGSWTLTPPRTATQTFSLQTVTAATLTRP